MVLIRAVVMTLTMLGILYVMPSMDPRLDELNQMQINEALDEWHHHLSILAIPLFFLFLWFSWKKG